MPIHIESEVAKGWSHWSQGFKALAVRRGEILLGPAGVPEGIVGSPAPIHQIATDYVVAEIQPNKRYHTSYWDVVLSLLRATFSEIADAYGDETAQSLYRWMLRSFVDREVHDALIRWDRVFPRLLPSPTRPSPTIPASLAGEVTGALMAAIDGQFSRDIRARDRELEAAASAVPLSDEEQELLRRGFSGLEGAPPWDVTVTNLSVATSANHAYLTWLQLRPILSPEQREELVRWAQEVATEPHSWARNLVDPTSLPGF